MTLKSTFPGTNGHHCMLFAALIPMGSPAADWNFLDMSVSFFYKVLGDLGFSCWCLCCLFIVTMGNLTSEHWSIGHRMGALIDFRYPVDIKVVVLRSC